MNNTAIILGCLALSARVVGSAADRHFENIALRAVGFLVASVAVWLGCLWCGMWASAWGAVATGIVVGVLPRRGESVWFRAPADVLIIFLSILLAAPKPSLTLTVGTLVFLVSAGILLERIVSLGSFRRWAGALMGFGVLGLTVGAVEPEVMRAVDRVVRGRVVPMVSGSRSAQARAGPDIRFSSRDPLVPEGIPLVAEGDTTHGMQWAPYLEWALPNPSHDGNPLDLEASATFVHEGTGETRRTPMFYNGGGEWNFRFTGTRPGMWTFHTSSPDPDLDGHQGVVEVAPSQGLPGFVVNSRGKWFREGSREAFVPQLVMFPHPHLFLDDPTFIEDRIELFLEGHGFNGFHVEVFCRWFDISSPRCSSINISDPDPDPRTFLALESLILRTYAAGGVVHLWAWGDDSQTENPKRWGLNGTQDRRLQRYIAARLGPLPGWTMGYGYDLWEWAEEEDLTDWHEFMHGQMGWPHLLGARSEKNRLSQLAEGMDYSAYEQHRPSFEDYVATLAARPDKPAFSEDRFRVRDEGRWKDYTPEEIRRGLWRSTIAGGVANIWGYLLDGGSHENGSRAFPNREELKTYSRFFDERFTAGLGPCWQETNVHCLADSSGGRLLLYGEDVDSVGIDLSHLGERVTAVAVDARAPYEELDLGFVGPGSFDWFPPFRSDWALAIGSIPSGG